MSNVQLRYKYVTFNEGALAIIKDGTMKFSHPKEFNDPFDCHPDFDAKEIANDVLETNTWIADEKTINRLIKKINSDYYKVINNKVGICSLSRNPLNLLMWAHYAKNHTGFIVEFAIPPSSTCDEDVYNLVPTKVKYDLKKPIILKNNAELYDKHFLIKSKDWRYENEERVVDHVRKAGIHPYNRKQILKSVIAGMRMSDDDFATLKNTVAAVNQELGIHVTVHKAEPVKGKFALYVPDRDDLNVHNAP